MSVECSVCKAGVGELRFDNPRIHTDILPTAALPKRLQFNFYCQCGHKTEFPVRYEPKKVRKVGP